MYFTLYGSNTVSQARGLTRDLKLGRTCFPLRQSTSLTPSALAEYTKLPPRVTFVMQLVGTVVGAILQLIIMKTIISAQRE